MMSEFMQESGMMVLSVGKDKHSGSFAHRIRLKSNLSVACLCQEQECVDSHYFTLMKSLLRGQAEGEIINWLSC